MKRIDRWTEDNDINSIVLGPSTAALVMHPWSVTVVVTLLSVTH